MGEVSSRAWAEVVSHDARFEFPDVIGFADGGPDGRGWRGGPWAAEGRLHRVAFVSKPNGGHRPLAVLDPALHCRYREAVASVAGAVERSLGGSVSCGRCVRTGSSLRLEPWRRGWRRHIGRVRRLERRGRPVVRLDVRDCYASIRPDVVGESLRRCGVDRVAAAKVEHLLVAFEADGIVGLPVGPEPSVVLANGVLAAGDRALRGAGIPFVRWCDDVTASVEVADPAEVVDAWAEALAPLGLRPAPEKTRLVERGRPASASWALVESCRPAGRRMARLVAPTSTPVRVLCELAVHAVAGPDPHLARAAVARAAAAGGREARAMLRHVRARAPHLAATVDWGLRP